MLDPYILNTVLHSLSFGISEFHLRMRQISRPKLYNYQKGNNCASQLKELIIFIK
jgi:hypothetical protein